MNSARPKETAMPPLKALGMALALALGSGACLAGSASVNITGFSASPAAFSGNYAWGVDAYQSYSMTAQSGGGLYGSSTDSFTANNWDLGASRLASTAYAQATGNTLQYVDNTTQLVMAGFNLGAVTTQALIYPAATAANYANATGLQSGALMLINGDGDAVAGTISFNIYYSLSVSDLIGGDPANYSQALVNLLASDDGGESFSFADGLLSSSIVGGAGTVSGVFTWTATLAAGDAAYYTLSGNAISSAANVPEPGGMALLGFGLAALTGVVRRRRDRV